MYDALLAEVDAGGFAEPPPGELTAEQVVAHLAANDELMSARLPGTSKAPPIPCSARATMSCSMLAAKPQSADATVKITTPMLKMRRRP